MPTAVAAAMFVAPIDTDLSQRVAPLRAAAGGAGQVAARHRRSARPAQTDPAVVEAALEFAHELLRSCRYPFIEAVSRGPDGAAILDEQHFEEQFERGLWPLIDGSYTM